MLDALHKRFYKSIIFAKAAFAHSDEGAQNRPKGSFMF